VECGVWSLERGNPSVTPHGVCLEVPVCGARHFHRTMNGARNCRPLHSPPPSLFRPPGAVGLGSHFQGRLLYGGGTRNGSPAEPPPTEVEKKFRRADTRNFFSESSGKCDFPCGFTDPSVTDINVGATSHFQGRLCSHQPRFGAPEMGAVSVS